MPNTKPYNKHSSVNAIMDVLGNDGVSIKVAMSVIENILTAAEQAGEERMREKAKQKSDEFEMKQLMTEEEVLKAFNSGPLYFYHKKQNH